MKKTTGVVLGLVLSMMLGIVAPVMAIGPWEAFEVGNNPNLRFALNAMHNLRGEAGGDVLWYDVFDSTGAYLFSAKWEFFDAISGGGKINHAIAADIATLYQFSTDTAAYPKGEPTVNENTWIFLSPEGFGNHYTSPLYPNLGSHGMIWWLFFGNTHNPTIAFQRASVYPSGVFWNYNFYK